MAVPSVAAGIKGRPSSYLGRMLPPYTKPHLSFADQLALLMQRGLARRINLGISWPSRMKAHWQAFPVMSFGSPIQGGFLAGWDAEGIWA